VHVRAAAFARTEPTVDESDAPIGDGVCDQISDALRANLGLGKQEAREQVVELISLVGIPSPRKHQIGAGRMRYATQPAAVAVEGQMTHEPMKDAAAACSRSTS
jgi:hypothetical protein